MTSPEPFITHTRSWRFEYTIRRPLPEFFGIAKVDTSIVVVVGAIVVEVVVGVGSTAALAIP